MGFDEVIDAAAVIVTVSAIFAYINARFLRFPSTIGVMLIAITVSAFLWLLSVLGITNIQTEVFYALESLDFNETLFQGMLSFLLFAGALHTQLHVLAKHKWTVMGLATVGVVISTLLIGIFSFYLLQWMSCEIPIQWCLLFGALITPTDPIAVLATFERLSVDAGLEATIAGESLFNDGVGVVVFSVMLLLLQMPEDLTAVLVAELFFVEAIGGVALGLLLGWVSRYLLITVNSYKIEVLITLATVMGGYGLAEKLHTSGPMAVVVAGLIIGHVLHQRTLSDVERESIHKFWSLIDEVFNIALFSLLGLEILLIPFEWPWVVSSLLLIPFLLLARAISVGVPLGLSRLTSPKLPPHLLTVLIWGGLRGGISVALALSLPAGEFRDLLLTLTYIVVIFSIVVQGLSIGWLIRWLQR